MIGWFHKFSFIWWFPEWQGFGYRSWKETSFGIFLDYSVLIGWLEIRVWINGCRPK